VEVFRLDEMVTLDGFHKLTGECSAIEKVNQFGERVSSRGKIMGKAAALPYQINSR
jgi:hypothetical protein